MPLKEEKRFKEKAQEDFSLFVFPLFRFFFSFNYSFSLLRFFEIVFCLSFFPFFFFILLTFLFLYLSFFSFGRLALTKVDGISMTLFPLMLSEVKYFNCPILKNMRTKRKTIRTVKKEKRTKEEVLLLVALLFSLSVLFNPLFLVGFLTFSFLFSFFPFLLFFFTCFFFLFFFIRSCRFFPFTCGECSQNNLN